MATKEFQLSIIIPVFNEEQNVDALLQKLIPVAQQYHYEILFVNDGSTDKTTAKIKDYANSNPHIKLVSFLRNFGHQYALAAGYKMARGECVISMDADLQDPVEIIPDMIAKWQKGAKIVYAKRKQREVDGIFKKFTASLFYKYINLLSDTPIPQDVGDFRLLDREVVNFIDSLPERTRFLRGLVAWGGYTTTYIYFNRAKRHAGKTHYTISKMFNFALDGITSFSTKPLRLATYLGFYAATIGFLGIIYAVLGRIFLPAYWVTGWAALFVGVMFIGGVQLITIGIIGEYISKIYQEVQKRPSYLIKETVNV